MRAVNTYLWLSDSLRVPTKTHTRWQLRVPRLRGSGVSSVLYISMRWTTKDFKITEELAAMRSMKGTMTGSDLFTEVNACFDKLGLKWDKLACATTDGCPI